MPAHTVDGVTFHYEDRGRGTPVVLLHGFPLTHAMWAAQAADLSADYRVIAPDLRGFGGSASHDPFTIDLLADDVHRLLAAVGGLPCVLGGLSMGGYVALSFARRYPADLRGLVLLDTRADADAPAARDARQRHIDLVRKQGPSAIADAMIPKLLAPGAADGRPELARALRQWIEACPGETIEHALAALRDRPDSTPALPAIKVPTLVVVGDGDQITPAELAEAMRKDIPAATLVVVRGAGHMTPIEQPAQVTQAIRQFLRRVDAGR